MKVGVGVIGLILFLLGSCYGYAQVGIDTGSLTGDAILDFGTDNNKGILLPRIISLNALSVSGTLFFDTNDSKVKFLGSSIVDLSVENVTAGNEFDVTAEEYNTLSEVQSSNGVILGTTTSTAPGVLVLESADKAMVLPKVTNYDNVGEPEAGMIVYDSTKKMLCVFDGEKWAFWGQ